MKEWTIQRLPNPGIHSIISLQTLTPLHILARFYRKDPDVAVSCETMPGPSKHRSGCSQSAIGQITGPPMEELEKVPKELGGSATLQVEQQYELTSTPQSSCLQLHMYQKMAQSALLEREAHWSCKLQMLQYRGTPGPRSGSRWVGEQVGRGVVGRVWGTFGIAFEL